MILKIFDESVEIIECSKFNLVLKRFKDEDDQCPTGPYLHINDDEEGKRIYQDCEIYVMENGKTVDKIYLSVMHERNLGISYGVLSKKVK